MPVPITLITERRVARKRLGRHIVHDPRSRDFVAEQAPSLVSVTHAAHGLPLDQGNLGSCTAEAGTGALDSDPYFLGQVRDQSFALDLYHRETELNPQFGVYPPADPGGCGLWVAQAMKNLGLISGYAHAFGIQQALLAVVVRPCIFGVNWYSSFDDVDVATGLVSIDKGASIRGGHEILADGIDATHKLVWFWNSWGSWGYQNTGRSCMTFDTLDRLLQEQGDCTQFSLVTPTPTPVPPGPTGKGGHARRRHRRRLKRVPVNQ
jgi:hypothetical protein